jgi:hypothetical protein
MTVIELLQYGGETVPQPQIIYNEKVKELENQVNEEDLASKEDLREKLYSLID